jgi:hypothetical protein
MHLSQKPYECLQNKSQKPCCPAKLLLTWGNTNFIVTSTGNDIPAGRLQIAFPDRDSNLINL